MPPCVVYTRYMPPCVVYTLVYASLTWCVPGYMPPYHGVYRVVYTPPYYYPVCTGWYTRLPTTRFTVGHAFPRPVSLLVMPFRDPFHCWASLSGP